MVVFGLRLNKARETIQYGCIWFTIEKFWVFQIAISAIFLLHLEKVLGLKTLFDKWFNWF